MSLTYNIKSNLSFAQLAGAFAMGSEEKKYETIETRYKKAITSAYYDSDFAWALKDPNSIVSKEFNALLINEVIEDKEIHEMQFRLVMAELKERKREKAEMAYELQLADLKNKQRELMQLTAPVLAASATSESPTVAHLRKKLEEMQTEAGDLVEQYYQLTQQQNLIQARWTEAFQEKSKAFVSEFTNFIRDNHISYTTPEGVEIELTEAKQQQLTKAGVPESPIVLADALAPRLDNEDEMGQAKIIDTAWKQRSIVEQINRARCTGGDENQPLLDDGPVIIKQVKKDDQILKQMHQCKLTNDICALFPSLSKDRVESLIHSIKEQISAKKYAPEFIRGGKSLNEVTNKLAQYCLDKYSNYLPAQYRLEDIAEMVKKVGGRKTPSPCPTSFSSSLLDAYHNRKQQKAVAEKYEETLDRIKAGMKDLNQILGGLTPKPKI